MSDPTEPKPTVSIPKSDILEGLLRVLTSKVDEVNARTVKICEETDTLIEDGKNVGRRLAAIEERLAVVEERTGRTSSRARAVSENDLKQQADIADGIVARKKLEERLETVEKSQVELHTKTDVQTALLTKLEANAAKIISNPWVRLILFTIASAIVAKYGIRVLPGNTPQ